MFKNCLFSTHGSVLPDSGPARLESNDPRDWPKYGEPSVERMKTSQLVKEKISAQTVFFGGVVVVVLRYF